MILQIMDDYKMNIHEIYEMFFLLKRKEQLMNMEEHLVLEYLYHNRLLKLNPDEQIKILKMRETLTKLLMEWDLSADAITDN